jgi:hypothetical protein
MQAARHSSSGNSSVREIKHRGRRTQTKPLNKFPRLSQDLGHYSTLSEKGEMPMNRELIQQMQSRFDLLAQTLPGENVEFWFARDLQEPLGYARWENSLTAIKRAIESCEKTGYNFSDHFRGVTKLITLGRGGSSRKNSLLKRISRNWSAKCCLMRNDLRDSLVSYQSQGRMPKYERLKVTRPDQGKSFYVGCFYSSH